MPESINKSSLTNFLEPHLLPELKEDKYNVKTLPAHSLLTHNRFDLAFKLLYLDNIEFGQSFAQHIYKEHIRALSLGTFTEPGNEKKVGIDLFTSEFKKTFENIKKNDFDSKKSLIPLSKNSTIANGAHRVASAIYLNINVKCVNIDTDIHNYNYKFFHERNVSEQILDAVALSFVEHSQNTYIAIIWPMANGKKEDLLKIIPNIVYEKSIDLNINGFHNLLSQIYFEEEWIGSPQNNFKGAYGKLIECYKEGRPLRVIAFQSDNLDSVLEIKEKIRSIFDIGKHSVHITDTKDEALRTARAIFNDNGIHFLNNSFPNKFNSLQQCISKTNSYILKNNIDPNHFILDGSMTLCAYGLRDSSDIDFLLSDSFKINFPQEEIENHEDQLIFHSTNKHELIFDQKHYFYFNNIKFLSFSQLYAMKQQRAEIKDQNDLQIMKALMDKHIFRLYAAKVKQHIFYTKAKLKQFIIVKLQQIGLYKIVRYFYRLIKG